MEVKQFTVVSQSRDGRKAMITYKSGKKSVTRHVRRVMNGWEYKTFRKANKEGQEVDVLDLHETFVTAKS